MRIAFRVTMYYNCHDSDLEMILLFGFPGGPGGIDTDKSQPREKLKLVKLPKNACLRYSLFQTIFSAKKIYTRKHMSIEI